MLPEEGGPSYIAASYVKFIRASGSKVRRAMFSSDVTFG